MLGSVLLKRPACLLQFDSAFIDDALEPSVFRFARDGSQMQFPERLGQLRRCVRIRLNQAYLLFAGHTGSLLQHHFRGFDNDLHRVAPLQLHLLGTLPGDYAFDADLAELHHDVGHDVAEGDLGDSSSELIPC
jgi:hypothetical protein